MDYKDKYLKYKKKYIELKSYGGGWVDSDYQIIGKVTLKKKGEKKGKEIVLYYKRNFGIESVHGKEYNYADSLASKIFYKGKTSFGSSEPKQIILPDHTYKIERGGMDQNEFKLVGFNKSVTAIFLPKSSSDDRILESYTYVNSENKEITLTKSVDDEIWTKLSNKIWSLISLLCDLRTNCGPDDGKWTSRVPGENADEVSNNFMKIYNQYNKQQITYLRGVLGTPELSWAREGSCLNFPCILYELKNIDKNEILEKVRNYLINQKK